MIQRIGRKGSRGGRRRWQLGDSGVLVELISLSMDWLIWLASKRPSSSVGKPQFKPMEMECGVID